MSRKAVFERLGALLALNCACNVHFVHFCAQLVFNASSHMALCAHPRAQLCTLSNDLLCTVTVATVAQHTAHCAPGCSIAHTATVRHTVCLLLNSMCTSLVHLCSAQCALVYLCSAQCALVYLCTCAIVHLSRDSRVSTSQLPGVGWGTVCTDLVGDLADLGYFHFILISMQLVQ